MFGGSDSGVLVAYFGNLGCFWAFLRKREIGAFYGRFWERLVGNGGRFGLGLGVEEMMWYHDGLSAREPDLILSVSPGKTPLPLRSIADNRRDYALFFNPWANARAAARSFSSGFPLLIPPKSFRGPTVSHPLQQNSSTITNPRLASFSFRAA